MSEKDNKVVLHESLRDAVEREGLDANKLTVALQVESDKIQIKDRHSIPVCDGAKTIFWSAPSLQTLFRGNQQPPSLERYPEEYVPYFFFVEKHVITLCNGIGDQTDQQLEELYSSIRRRPDGRALGGTHDFLWQVAALLLGSKVLSAAEFEAIFGKLAGSTRKWAMRPVSRNYIFNVRALLER